MKKSIFIIITVVLFGLSFSSVQQENDNFYYYQGEKIFLQQRKEVIVLKFAPNASREQLSAIVGRDVSLRSTSDIF